MKQVSKFILLFGTVCVLTAASCKKDRTPNPHAYGGTSWTAQRMEVHTDSGTVSGKFEAADTQIYTGELIRYRFNDDRTGTQHFIGTSVLPMKWRAFRGILNMEVDGWASTWTVTGNRREQVWTDVHGENNGRRATVVLFLTRD